MCCCSCWFSTLPEMRSRWTAETRPCVWEKSWQDSSSESWIVLGADFYEPNSCASPYLEKQNPSLWWLRLVTSRKLHQTSRNLLGKKKSAWLHVYSPFIKITYILTSLEQVLRVIWGAVSQAEVLILPQITRNSHIVQFFFSLHGCGSNTHMYVMKLQ